MIVKVNNDLVINVHSITGIDSREGTIDVCLSGGSRHEITKDDLKVLMAYLRKYELWDSSYTDESSGTWRDRPPMI